MNYKEFKIRLIAGLALVFVAAIGIRWLVRGQVPVGESESPSESSIGRSSTTATKSPHAASHVVTPADSSPIRTEITDVSRDAHSGCFLARFQHPRSTGHQTRGDCAKHQNEIVLPAEGGLLKALQEKGAVCVRVDGNAVDFEKKGGRIVFGNVAGPDSVVTIRYCLGKSKCSESCEPGKDSKDSFMEALGASDGADQGGDTTAQWDPSDRDEGDVVTEFADVLEAEKRQPHAQLVLSSAWSAEAVTAGCNITSVSSR